MTKKTGQLLPLAVLCRFNVFVSIFGEACGPMKKAVDSYLAAMKRPTKCPLDHSYLGVARKEGRRVLPKGELQFFRISELEGDNLKPRSHAASVCTHLTVVQQGGPESSDSDQVPNGPVPDSQFPLLWDDGVRTNGAHGRLLVTAGP